MFFSVEIRNYRSICFIIILSVYMLIDIRVWRRARMGMEGGGGGEGS